STMQQSSSQEEQQQLQQQQQHQEEDLTIYQALYDQFRSEVSAAEVGDVQSLGVELDPDESVEAAGICRVPISDFGNQGFVLRGFLSPGECQRLVDSAEASGGLKPTPFFRQEYRSCHRLVLHEPELARQMFLRLRPYLPDKLTFNGQDDPITSHRVHGAPWLLKGNWEPYCLNPVLRLCRYHPGQHFSPHYDGLLVHDDACRSMQTFMVYLTDNPASDGGATNFLDDGLSMSSLISTTESATESDGTERQRMSAPQSQIICQVHPERGSLLVFNHYRLHEGERLAAGVKYILRSDIMYRRITAAPQSDEKFREALRLQQEAERLESRGQADEAVKLYRKAFRLYPNLENYS
ncbi:hypothetical protein BOX15_Mlig003788g6, partial [Macrostomum lignano]